MHLTVRLRVSIIRVYLRIDIDILVNSDLVRDMNDRLAIIIWHNYGCFGTLEIEKESYCKDKTFEGGIHLGVRAKFARE